MEVAIVVLALIVCLTVVGTRFLPSPATPASEPGPITKAVAEAIGYIRFLSTLGAVVFIVWLSVEAAKSLSFHAVETAEGVTTAAVTIESGLPLALLTAVLTALLGIMGGLIAGPNPLAVAHDKSLDIIAQNHRAAATA